MSIEIDDIYDPTKTVDDHLNKLKEELLALNNTAIVQPGTPMENIFSVIASVLYAIEGGTRQLINEQSPITASLTGLINKYSLLYGVAYKSGEPTTQTLHVEVEMAPITLYSETTPTHNQFSVSDDNGNIYIPQNDITFTEPGFYDVVFVSKEKGAISSKLHTINNMLNPIRGVKSVDNIQTYSKLGTSPQTQEQFSAELQKATIFYKTKGTQEGVIRDLKNNGCTNAYIYFNGNASMTVNEVPAGCMGIIVEGGEDKDITDILLRNIQAGGMYMFGNVVNPSGTCIDYSTIATYFNQNIIVWKNIADGTIAIKQGNTTYTATSLDFRGCETKQDVIDYLNIECGFENIVFSLDENDKCIMASTLIGEKGNLQFIPSNAVGTDLYLPNLLDGANSVATIATDRINISYTYTALDEQIGLSQYIGTVCFNRAVIVQFKVKLKYYGASIYTEQQKELIKQKVAQLFSYMPAQDTTASSSSTTTRGINVTINSAHIMSFFQQALRDEGFDGYFDNLLMIREDDFNNNTSDWATAIRPKHIYEILNLSSENIDIIL